jgi:hypothetical protein
MTAAVAPCAYSARTTVIDDPAHALGDVDQLLPLASGQFDGCTHGSEGIKATL